MNPQLFYDKQAELEQFIRENLGMTEEEFTSEEMIDKRIFAFKVEVGELANEHGWFKYWKQSHTLNHLNTLEELTDCIHFLTAIGLYRKYTKFVTSLEPEPFVDKSFDFLYTAIMENGIHSAGQWKRAFEQLIAIGLKIGYELNEIELAYLMKNERNKERQRQNY